MDGEIDGGTAILVIDTQVGFYKEYEENTGDSESLVKHRNGILQLITRSIKERALLVLIRMDIDEYGEVLPEISDAVEGYDRVEYVVKNAIDAYEDGVVLSILNENKIRQVIVTGLYTEVCIRVALESAAIKDKDRHYVLPLHLTLSQNPKQSLGYYIQIVSYHFKDRLKVIEQYLNHKR